MAEGEAEKRHIARLDFNVDDAIHQLERVDKTLKSIAEQSGLYSKEIGKNIGSSFDFSKVINVDTFSQQLSQVANISKKDAEKLVANIIKNEQDITAKKKIEQEKRQTAEVQANAKLLVSEGKTADKIKTISAETEAFKEKKAYAAMLKQEEYNNRVAKSTESLYDKITQYAKTYVIYQGFNMLKQAISETIDEMVQVQYRMVEIDRVLNESSLDIDKYRDKLIQLAYDYGNSFDNVSDITLRLAKAGFDAQESLALTEKTLLALNTAELNATQATDDMVAVMAQWGLTTGTAEEQAKAYGDIIDKVNKIGDNFPTTSEDVMNALKKVSSAFNLAGASIDETIATIVAAEKASQRGGKVIGTALSNIIQQLKTEGRINIMESLGIDVYKDATKSEFNSVIDILGQLSSKMQELKNNGKESSAEMQNLLEVFTVFRRNIGAGLLSEMAGEESTYADALKMSIESVGYSIQENEKHMKTAKAAQAQFNAELLKLKTQVWDKGLEDVFRSMLLLGSNVADGITNLIDKFGALPVAIGTATAALMVFSKKMKIASYDSETGIVKIKGLTNGIANIRNNIKNIDMLQNSLRGLGPVSSTSFGMLISNVTAYSAKATVAAIKTMALKAAVLALNLAATAAATAGIMVITAAIQEMANKQQAAIDLEQKSIQTTEDRIKSIEEEKEAIDDVISSYDELAKKRNRTPEDTQKLLELQIKIKDILGEQASAIDLINGKYEEQKGILNQISIEEQKKVIEQKREIARQKEAAGVRYELPSAISRSFGGKNYEDVLKEYGGTELYQGSLKETLENVNLEEAIELFTKWKENLTDIQGQSVEINNTYNWINSTLKELTDNVETSKKATEDLQKEQAKLFVMEAFGEDRIKKVEDYNKALQTINQIDFSGFKEGFKENVIGFLQSTYPQFIEQNKALEGTLEDASSSIKAATTSLQNLQNQYSILTAAQEEYNTTGELTAATLESLINNNLLQYLTIQNGKLIINSASMEKLAEQTKIDAINALQSAASNDIMKVALNDVKNISPLAKGAIDNLSGGVESLGSDAETSTGKLLELASSIAAAKTAAEGNLGEGVNLETFKAQANAIEEAYMSIAKSISNISISSGSSSSKSGGSGGSSSAAANAAKREAEEAAKAAQQAEEDAYKARLAAFKNYITEKERLEKRWVDKQKKLGLLSNDDYLYITEQRINRYKKYLDELNKATWMKEEDRLELQKTYTEKIEDLQVDYFDYLEDKLNDEIDAYKKANEEKIELIKQEADERINALRSVESENDRIRRKEEYEKKRAEHLEDISYWEQRTGREAQEALKEARKNLKELDEEWEQQLEDWSIDDQIKAIEDERDAQIKAIEDTQQAEIDSMKVIYDAKVQLFTESGQIIYENSVIQSENLYNQYKNNFIDPIKKDLEEINKVVTPQPAQVAPQQQYETYLIKSGDTLSKIARNYGTTVDKIMEANPYIKNRNLIYAGKTLQIPKFHEGGIVGGHKEAFALLKPDEVILKPEWAEGINKLVSMVKNNENPITNNSTVIEVSGDLVKIDAKISNKTEAEYLTRRVEQMLKDKFNIKK